MTEFDGDPRDCVWEAFWRLATAGVPTEILGTYLAARIVPATKPNGGVRPFAIGQVIRRLVCKATAKLLTKKVRSMTCPTPVCCGNETRPRATPQNRLGPRRHPPRRCHGQCRCEKCPRCG